MDLNGTFTQSLDELVQRVMPSLVVVHGRRWSSGAGVVWSADGLILTNNHVVGRRPFLVKLYNGQEYEPRLLARDPEVDLALLAIEADDLSPLEPGTESPRIGEMVFAFGHSWGQRNAVTSGIVSAVLSAHTRRGKDFPVLRTDAPLAPGNSGGPLVDVQGRMLGINSMIMGGDQGIAIPISVIEAFIEKAVKKKRGKRQKHTVSEGML
jgi:S1-C subfamily serine protease